MNPCFCIGPRNGDQYCRCVMLEKGLKMNEPSKLELIYSQEKSKDQEQREKIIKEVVDYAKKLPW